MAPKKLLSLQDVLNACLESDNEGSDLGVDSNDSLNEDSSEKINLLQLTLSFDEKQAVFKHSVFLPPMQLPPNKADCVPDPATATVSFVRDEADSIRTTHTVIVKNTP